MRATCDFLLTPARTTRFGRPIKNLAPEYRFRPGPQRLSSGGRNAFTFSTQAPSPDQFVVSLTSRGTFGFDPPHGEIEGEDFELTIARVDAYDPIGAAISAARTEGSNVVRAYVSVRRDGRVRTSVPGRYMRESFDTHERSLRIVLPYVMRVKAFDRRRAELTVDLELSLGPEPPAPRRVRVVDSPTYPWRDFSVD